MPHDLYDVLGVPRTASEAEIRHAFWELAKRYHPDTHPGSDDAARRFVEVSSAAETLLDSKLRARYDETHGPAATATPAAAAPKPPPPQPPPPHRAAQAAGTAPTAAPESGWPQPGNDRGDAAKVIAAVLGLAAIAGLVLWQANTAGRSQRNDVIVNGSVVWQAADFSLDDGYGVNLAGSGARIQIFPGSSADIEYAGGYLGSAGSLTLLPPGQAATYQRCLAATRQEAGQPQPASQVAPTVGRSLCVSGSGGDLASVEVIGADGSAVTLDITAWEYV